MPEHEPQEGGWPKDGELGAQDQDFCGLSRFLTPGQPQP
jgi:hypothetical protein